MAPRKRPPNTAEAARNDGCNLLTDYFKRNRAGRPKKRGNSANDNVQAQPAEAVAAAVAYLAAPAVMEDLAATTDEPAQTDPVATGDLAATRLD